MFNFQDFPGPVLFQDFPVPGIFKKKIQDIPGLSGRRGNPVYWSVKDITLLTAVL